MPVDASVTITAASSVDTTAYKRLKLGAGPGMRDQQVARVCVAQTQTGTPSGTATLRFALVDSSTGKVLTIQDAALSQPTVAQRDALAGSSGDYLAKVAFANGSDILDLLGATTDGVVSWWVGAPDAFPANVSGYTVNLCASQAV